MSIQCMNRVWKYSKQKGSGLLLLLAIADVARDNGVAWPGIRGLARKTRVSKRTVIRLIQKAEQAGELQVRRFTRGNTYWLSVWGWEGPDFRYCENCGAIDDPSPTGEIILIDGDKILCPDCNAGTNGKKKSGDKMSHDIVDTFKVTLVDGLVTKPAPKVTPMTPEPLFKPQSESQKKPKRARPSNVPNAVELLKRINHRYPPKKLYATIDRTVSDTFSGLLRWGRIIRQWIAQGYSPTNYAGMMDVYKAGWIHGAQRQGKPSFVLDTSLSYDEQIIALEDNDQQTWRP